jgi:3'-phosphoadenosine 5'-phosphosulfate sulfotransferase (PAPS reductase)/FAD synthetase
MPISIDANGCTASAKMSDPFRISAPAAISFSGGRTSAYMLWRIIQAYGGELPPGVKVVFANTGAEFGWTLDFVERCSEAWSVPITWLEYRHGYRGRGRRQRWAEVVTHATASRNKEPFEMLLESKQIVPDRSRRFCTIQLKSLTVRRHLRALGWRSWSNVIGFRADEGGRIDDKLALEAAAPGPELSTFPLSDAGITRPDVLRFWRGQNFDLELDQDGDGGNCDGCFMFSAARLGRMFQKYPERMDWWPRTEQRLGTKTMAPGRSYASIRQVALMQGTLALAWDDASPCSETCGV